MSHLKLPPYQKSQRKSYAGFSTPQSASAQSNFSTSFQLVVTAPSGAKMASDKIPSGYVLMDHQVAGHTFHVGTDEIGMLKSSEDGSVLKPGGSAMCAAREIKFYELLATTTDPNILPLREFTSDFRGTKALTVGNKTINFIKLQDLTNGMLEPCIIDLKMGCRTWDPLATDQKRESEDGKYKQCKGTVGFCIPGFQAYQISSGTYKKFGKEYGKKLNQNTVKDALRVFLNADSGLNRQLITSILTSLWAIQKFMRTQTIFQFFSSSILIVYDARKLRQVLETQKRQNSSKLLDPNGLNVIPSGDSPKGSKGDLIASPVSNRNSGSFGGNGDALNDAPKVPKSVYKKLQRSHSSTNDYEKEMRNIKGNYQQMLDSMVGVYNENKEWVQVKMIDFAHAFTNSEFPDGQAAGVDLNYLDGIEHLVEIFEEFLKQCD